MLPARAETVFPLLDMLKSVELNSIFFNAVNMCGGQRNCNPTFIYNESMSHGVWIGEKIY